MTVHFECVGKPFLLLLDLVEVAKSHTGVTLATAFMTILKTFGVQEKVRVSNRYQMKAKSLTYGLWQILGITGNNTSNNDKMIEHLSNTLKDFPGPANQTCCFVHTVNLIVKSILKLFDIRKRKDLQVFNKAAHALADLVDGQEEAVPDDEENEDEENEEEEDDNKFNTCLEPIQSMLLKVCLCVRP